MARSEIRDTDGTGRTDSRHAAFQRASAKVSRGWGMSAIGGVWVWEGVVLDGHKADNPIAPAFVRCWSDNGQVRASVLTS